MGNGRAERFRGGVSGGRPDRAPTIRRPRWTREGSEGAAGVQKSILGVVAVATGVRLAVAAAVPLFPDEAYYWEWSRRLAAGYFDHPPAIALAIRAGTEILGPTRLGVRFVPILLGAITVLAVAGTARRLAGERAGLLAAVIASVIPLAAGSLLATPDAPLLAFEALALYTVVRALERPPGSAAATRWWLGGGVALGCAFASKYTAVLVPAGIVVAMLSWRGLRARLRGPGPWLAALTATLVFLPVLIWNARHGWVSFLFQIRHGIGDTGITMSGVAVRELELLGGQAGLFSPILFVLGGLAVGSSLRGSRPPAARALATTALVAFAVFACSAVSKRVEANWPAVAYPPLIALVAAAPWRATGARWLRRGIDLAAALTLAAYLHALVPILPLHGPRDPIARAAGWDTLARAADSTAARMAEEVAPARVWLGGTRYQVAAQLAFHARGRPRTFVLGNGRPSEYMLWPGLAQLARYRDALVLAAPDDGRPPAIEEWLRACFEDAAPGARIELRRGDDLVTRQRIWILTGWRRACTAEDAVAGAVAGSGAPRHLLQEME